MKTNKKMFFWVLCLGFVFGFVLVVSFGEQLALLALIVCALVACMAAYTSANAVAVTSVFVVFVVVLVANVHKHLEQAHPVMEVVKLGMDARDQRLSEFRNKVLEVLYDSQCHLNHDVRDHVCGQVFAALYFASSANALLVFVDLSALNLLNANDHFVIVADVFQQRQNGHGVLTTISVALISVALIKLNLDGKKVIAEQFGAASNDE